MSTRKPHPDSIDVEIFGSLYTLRGGADPSTVRALASELDGRMRELAAPASSADPLKVAVLAALRLLEELHAAQGEGGGREADVVSRIEALTGRLDAALAMGPADAREAGGTSLDGGLPLG